jgi:hypothetical protein
MGGDLAMDSRGRDREMPNAEMVLAYALQYLELGWSVIPVRSRTKYPTVHWGTYQARRPTEAEVRAWFSGSEVNSIGIVTGAISGLTIVDCDNADALALARQLGLPRTPSVKTARGWHFYFTFKGGSRNFQKRRDLPGLDLRSEGGYVLAPPSIHETGVEYTWLDNDSAFAELPDWVLADTRDPVQRPAAVHCYRPTEEGQRNDTLARLAGVWVHLGEDHALAIAGMWNATMCQPSLPWREVESTVRSIAAAELRSTGQDGPSAEPFYRGVRL